MRWRHDDESQRYGEDDYRAECPAEDCKDAAGRDAAQ